MIQAPEVDFYGELEPWPASALVHSEAIVERSALHDWRIRPHRHNDLVQIFLLLEGSGQVRLDSDWSTLNAGALLLVPQRVVHELVWDRPSNGYVLSIRRALIDAVTGRVKALSGLFDQAVVLDLGDTFPLVAKLFSEIHNESVDSRPLKDVALESLVRLLAIWLGRETRVENPVASRQSRSAMHYARFIELVDAHHKEHWSVSDYSNALGMTPSHLNSICRRQNGKPSLQIIHERLMLAARRNLTYTERNIASVALHLGFDDPSYFARFFKRETGMTPGEYRRQSGTYGAGHS